MSLKTLIKDRFDLGLANWVFNPIEESHKDPLDGVHCPSDIPPEIPVINRGYSSDLQAREKLLKSLLEELSMINSRDKFKTQIEFRQVEYGVLGRFRLD